MTPAQHPESHTQRAGPEREEPLPPDGRVYGPARVDEIEPKWEDRVLRVEPNSPAGDQKPLNR